MPRDPLTGNAFVYKRARREVFISAPGIEVDGEQKAPIDLLVRLRKE